jgi:hypothetical protein
VDKGPKLPAFVATENKFFLEGDLNYTLPQLPTQIFKAHI